MEYTMNQGKVIFMEYGRNIQKLVQHAVTIEDKEERAAFAKAIVNLMGQMHPHLRNVDEFRSKLWTQLFIMSEYKLDVESPYPKPAKLMINVKPEKVEYPQSRLKFKHYGKNVEHLIAKAIEMEDSAKKDAFICVIANYMKMVYRNWNRDGISDEIIKADLIFLSEGRLELPPNVILDQSNANYSPRTSNSNLNSGHQSNSHSNNYGRKKKKADHRSGGQSNNRSRGRSNYNGNNNYSGGSNHRKYNK